MPRAARHEVVKEWTAQARAESKVEALLQVLERRFKKIPDDLRTTIVAVRELERLTSWIDLAFASRTLRAFRNKAGI